MEHYRLPRLCAYCGIETPTNLRTITLETVSLGWVTLLGMLVGMAAWNHNKYTFQVPLCDGCKEKMDARDQLLKWMMAGCASIFLIGVIIWVILSQMHQDNAFEFSLVAILTINFVILIAHALLKIRLAAFNGQYFKFKNAAFFKEFSRLNPTLVKPSRRSLFE